MPTFVALLRAVNVGGTGKLPMSERKRRCEERGFEAVRTFIASGNVVFESQRPEAEVKSMLEAALAAYAGKPVGVRVRTAAEMAKVLAGNPFPKAPSKTVAICLDPPPPQDALTTLRQRAGEEVGVGPGEIYVYYPEGIGNSRLRISRLRIPAARDGTGRNRNTVAKLAEKSAPRPQQSALRRLD